MSKYREIMGRVSYGLFLIVVALLPFPQAVLRPACVLWIIAWILEGRWTNLITKHKSQIANYKSALPFLLFGVWYGWKMLSGLWAADHGAWAWQMERYMTFGLLIPVGIWGVNEHYDWRQAGRVLAVSCVLAIPAYTVWMAVLYHHPEIVARLPLSDVWTQHSDRWIFFSDNISHFKHRLFLCSVEIAGAVAAIQVWRKEKWKWMTAVPVMLSSILLTGSRQAVISMVGVAVVWGMYHLAKRHHRWYSIGVLVMGVVAAASMLSFHPRMQQFDYLRDITAMREVSYYHDIRYNLWGFALQEPEDYIAYGLGAGQSKEYLAQRFKERQFSHYALMRYHAHNQYLEELMEIGIAGMIFFIIAWLSIPLCARKHGRETALLFTSLFMLNMCTDCMFGKFDGIALWAVGMIVILLQSDAEGEEKSAGNTQAHRGAAVAHGGHAAVDSPAVITGMIIAVEGVFRQGGTEIVEIIAHYLK